MRLPTNRTSEALEVAHRWSADTVDGVSDLPWGGAVTGGQVRRWLAALVDLGWRPPEREPVTVADLRAQAFGEKTEVTVEAAGERRVTAPAAGPHRGRWHPPIDPARRVVWRSWE